MKRDNKQPKKGSQSYEVFCNYVLIILTLIMLNIP